MSYASGAGLDSQPPSEGPVAREAKEYVLVHGDAAHDPMVSAPDELARILDRI